MHAWTFRESEMHEKTIKLSGLYPGFAETAMLESNK